MKKKKYFDIKRILKNGAWVFLTLMGIQSFFFKTPYAITVGMMLILISLLFCIFLDKIFNRINVNLTKKQKWFIGITNFLVAAYAVKPYETNYYKCIISFMFMIMFWCITIIYSKHKNK